MHRVALIVVVLGIAPSALAESPPLPCDRPWWEDASDVPLELGEVPELPTLFLPVRVLDAAQSDEVLLVSAEAVSVQVRDAAGELVDGALDIAGDEHPALDGVLRWRPLSALTAGERYTVALVVADSPEGWDPWSCATKRGFTNEMTFTVAVAPRETPSLELSVEVRESWTTGVEHGFCDAMEFEARCDEPAHICCTLTRAPEWWVTSRLAIVGVLPPPLYTVARFEIEWPGDGPRVATRHPIYGGTIETSDVGPAEDEPGAEAFCVTATVSDLMSGEVLASARVCPDAAETIHEDAPAPLDACEPLMCASFDPEPTEPGPESAEVTSEPGPESAEPGPEPSDEGDVAEAEAVADPAWDQSPSGCEGGSGGWFALALFALLRGRVRRTQQSWKSCRRCG